MGLLEQQLVQVREETHRPCRRGGPGELPGAGHGYCETTAATPWVDAGR